MTKRESISKTTRFEIFKRDSFTCQYCGRQPPKVVLVVDHIVPVYADGNSDPINLVTACEGCNAGKGRRSLSVVPIRPDADFMYLKAQQELAELKRYQKAKKRLDAEREVVAQVLQDLYFELSGVQYAPALKIFKQFIAKYSPAIVQRAVESAAPKVGGGYLPGAGVVPYIWKTCRCIEEEQIDPFRD